MPPRQSPSKHHCVVAGAFAREQIDPRIKAAYDEIGVAPKFGDLRKIWRKRHCATLNPYGFEDCPYDEQDCAMAYLSAIQTSVHVAAHGNPVGYFWRLAYSMAVTRADEKPLLRDREDAKGSSHTRHAQSGDQPGSPGVVPAISAVQDQAGRDEIDPGLRGRLSRPEHIGALLGSFDIRSRPWPERGRDGEEEGKERSAPSRGSL